MTTAASASQRPDTPSTEAEQGMDLREAARLLETTSRRAQRTLAPTPPLLSVAAGVLLLGIYGALWLSVRGQHPYTGPSLAVVGLVYLALALFAVIFGSWRSFARAGVTGRSRREERLRAVPIVVSMAGFYTFLGGLNVDGFGPAVVYGVVDAAGPWLVAGAAFAGWAAAKGDRLKLGLGIGMVAGAATSAFFGPETVWALIGVLGCAVAFTHAAAQLVSARTA